MRVIEPNFEIMDKIKGEDILRKIELCGRVCYKSENSITSESARKFVKNIIKSGCKFCSNGTPILKLAVHPF